MFDDLIVKPRPRRWKTAVIVGSALAHAGVITGIAIAAMWHVEKLEVRNDVDITYRVPAPQGAAAPPPSAGKLAVRKEPPKVVKIKPDVLTQPKIVKDPDPVTPATGSSTSTGTNLGPGGDGTDPDADPNSKGTCLTPGGCIDDSKGDPPDPDPEPVVAQKKPPIVPPNVAKGLRISGNEQIHPPEMVRVDMLHQGKNQLRATIQVCVGTDGTVDALRVLGSSGFEAYDAKLLSEMRNWRYRPYLVDGRASAMCTVSVFQYRMTK